MGFFVQSILADRYIHRRELRLVSLESLSCVEYGIKKIKFIKIFQNNVVDFKFKDQNILSAISIEFFCHEFRPNISQNSDFFIKNKKVSFVHSD